MLRKIQSQRMGCAETCTNDWWACFCWGHWTSYSDPFLSKQIASSVFKKKKNCYPCLFFALKISACWSQGCWFWKPIIKDKNSGVGKDGLWIVFSFLFIRFNFLCPITWGRLSENSEKSGLICKLWGFTAHTLLLHLPFQIRWMRAEFHISHLCIALSDQHHP